MSALDDAVQSAAETSQWLRENGATQHADQLDADVFAAATRFRALDALAEAALQRNRRSWWRFW